MSRQSGRWLTPPYRSSLSHCSRTFAALMQVGCLLTSTSMALRQRNVSIPADNGLSVPADPNSLTRWLRSHGGFVGQTDDLIESVVPLLDPTRLAWTNASMHPKNDISWDAIVAMLVAGSPVIANVEGGRHFVLVVGYDRAQGGDTLYVNDPGYDRQSYSYTHDVVGWRLYEMR